MTTTYRPSVLIPIVVNGVTTGYQLGELPTGDQLAQDALPTTFNNNIAISKLDGGSATFNLDSAVNYRCIRYSTNKVPRWDIITNGTIESGSNVGSDFGISRYSDAGGYLDTPLFISRATGVAFIPKISTGFVIQAEQDSFEGGQFSLQKPNTGSNLAGDLNIDLAGNSFRIFENGGVFKGITLDITTCAAAASSILWHSDNDGSGSGLDADLLDGKQGSYYASSSSLVSTPTLSGNDLAGIDLNYVVTFSATSRLNSVSIAEYRVTLPNGTIVSVTSGQSYTWTVPTSNSIGSSATFSVIAVDSLGNVSNSGSKTITVVRAYVNTPTITSPANNATNIQYNFTASTGSFILISAGGYSDTHQYTDWEIWTGPNRTGTLVYSSLNDGANLTTITVIPTSLTASTTYYLAARHKGTNYGWSGYTYCTFTTAAQIVPSVPGTPYRGGFYAGRIVIGASTYAIVVSPKASGNTTRQWKLTNDTTAGTSSLNDGLSNSGAMNNANHQAAQFCRALTINGFSDWYLPSRDELEVCYRNLKPTTTANTVYASRIVNFGSGYTGVDSQGNGDNDYSVNSSGVYDGVAYTSGSPAQTAVTAFQAGGTECFDTGWYWSSTEFSSTTAWGHDFIGGFQGYYGKTNTGSVRAVRKVLI